MQKTYFNFKKFLLLAAVVAAVAGCKPVQVTRVLLLLAWRFIPSSLRPLQA